MNASPSPLFAAALALLVAHTLLPAAEPPEPAPDFVWAVQAGGVGHDKTRGLATDLAGNIYLTGEFAKTATFGDFTVESKGDLDFFVAKYAPDGKCVWVRTGGGSKIDRGYGVAVDGQGNVYATGHCQSPDATFDGTPMENRGDYDLFVVKYDATGKLLWLKSGGGAGYDYGHGIGVDQAGNCYVTGAIVGDGEFLGAKVTNIKSGHVFLAKLYPGGELAWLNVSGGAGGSAGESVAVDAAGNAVVVGGASGAMTIGRPVGGLLEDTLHYRRDLDFKSGREAYAVKYDPSGEVIWTFTGEGSTNALFSSVALDGRGGVSLCGMFQGTLALGGEKIESLGANDFLFAKLDAGGKLRWSHAGGGPGIDYALCVAADDAGNSYVTGEFSNTVTLAGTSLTAKGTRDLYVAKFDDLGVLRWVRLAGGTRGSLGYCLVRDHMGQLYVSGAFDGEATYGSTTLTSKGSNDVMLLKMGRE